MRGEFMKFLKEYNVIGLAIAVIIGGVAGELVKAIVEGILMPFVTPILSAAGGSWRTVELEAGPFRFAVGAVLAALINFLIIAWLVFLFAKHVLKEETVTKK
ncbi:MAG TPA: MscL family protein [Gemmatimonadales bacterium]|jgi:large conductance mechanosensitive channel|nr:MscL family protein [Gemmatimonadales bacterium]